MKTGIVIFLFCTGLLTASCSKMRYMYRSEGQREQLSRRLGFKLSGKDDLEFYAEAAAWLGTPYRYGGLTRKGVDCSGLVGQIYRRLYRVDLERTADGMARRNCSRIRKSNLRTGDLVFFNTLKKNRKGVNHVGLFLKDGYFIHASTSQGVVVNRLQEDYYRKVWKQGGRIRR